MHFEMFECSNARCLRRLPQQTNKQTHTNKQTNTPIIFLFRCRAIDGSVQDVRCGIGQCCVNVSAPTIQELLKSISAPETNYLGYCGPIGNGPNGVYLSYDIDIYDHTFADILSQSSNGVAMDPEIAQNIACLNVSEDQDYRYDTCNESDIEYRELCQLCTLSNPYYCTSNNYTDYPEQYTYSMKMNSESNTDTSTSIPETTNSVGKNNGSNSGGLSSGMMTIIIILCVLLVGTIIAIFVLMALLKRSHKLS